MVRVDQAIIARLKKEGETFEILVDCNKALAYREGKIKEISEVLASKEIFADVKKGLRASEKEIKRIFKTDTFEAIADSIIKKGEIQITAEHRNTLREEKRKQIIQFIHRNAIDAKTGHPHPLQRIETLMEQAKIKIDEFHSVDAQVQEVINKLRPFIPIKLEMRELTLIVPTKYAHAVFAHVKKEIKVLKEQWQSDGSLKIIIEIPAGIQEEVEDKLNALSKGEIDITILNKK
ncbi:MAG: ribosome assembly factor SBDS [bacterium]|nr:ribosome assembly factor SBDS [bacterium]